MFALVGLWILGKRSYKSPYLRRVLGVTRVIAYGTVVAAGLGAFAARSAVADVSEGSLRVGRELDKLSDLLGKTNELTLNGEKVYFSQASTTEDVGTVLNRFQGHCDEDPGMAGIDWQDLAKTKLSPTQKPEKNLGVMRNEGANDGVVLCFRRSEGAAGSKTFLNALAAFSKSNDLADIGNLRYVHASRAPNGQTSMQIVWTNGSFKMGNLFPPTDGKDAPGSDSAVLPRPDHSQRILTATAAHTPYVARIYATADDGDKALAAYDGKMESAGWAIITPPVGDQPSTKGHWYERQGAQSMISVSRNNEGQTVMVVGDLGAELEKTPAAVEVLP